MCFVERLRIFLGFFLRYVYFIFFSRLLYRKVKDWRRRVKTLSPNENVLSASKIARSPNENVISPSEKTISKVVKVSKVTQNKKFWCVGTQQRQKNTGKATLGQE